MDVTQCDFCGEPYSPDKVVELRSMKLCVTCKPRVVKDIKSGAQTWIKCPAGMVETIRGEIRSQRYASYAFCGLGGVLFLLGLAFGLGEHPQLGPLGWIGVFLGAPLLYMGAVFYACMKGRSGSWAYVLMFTGVGLVLLVFLRKSCRFCDTSHPSSRGVCINCNAPL